MSESTKVQSAALKATRTAAGLPTDIGFHRSIDSGLAHDIDAVSSRVLNLTNRLLQYSSSGNSQAAKGKGKARLEDQDDVVDNFHSLVVDVMDELFERTVSLVVDFWNSAILKPALRILVWIKFWVGIRPLRLPLTLLHHKNEYGRMFFTCLEISLSYRKSPRTKAPSIPQFTTLHNFPSLSSRSNAK
jgi:hypothetical protein